MTVDAEPIRESVLQNVFFSVEGVQDRVGVRLIEGKDRERILESRKRRSMYRTEETPEFPALLIQSKLRFPNEAKVSLVWGRGVVSKTGVPTDQDQVLPFKTRKAFSAAFRCQRENPRAGCLPITPMRLDFSAPVPKEAAKEIVLKGPEGRDMEA